MVLHLHEQCISHAAIQRTYRSATNTRSVSSAAALEQPPPQPTLSQQIQALPEVQLKDLPIASIGDQKIAVGWDTRTWSRLCVCLSLTG